MYKLYRIRIHCMLCVACVLYSFHINIVEVQQKTIKVTEMIDHSLERKFYGACTMD